MTYLPAKSPPWRDEVNPLGPPAAPSTNATPLDAGTMVDLEARVETGLESVAAAAQPLTGKDQINGYAGLDGSGLLKTAELPPSVATDSSGSDATSVVTKAGSPSASRRRGLRDFISFKDYITDYSGTSDTTTARDAWLADCASLASVLSLGVKAVLPGGNYSWNKRLRVPNGVKLVGDGPRASVIYPTATYNDNCIVGPTNYTTQEYCGIEGVSIWGSPISATTTPVTQANGGGATTVTDSTFTPIATTIPPFTLGVASTAGYTSTGTLLVGGSIRVMYDGIVGNVFQNCFITTGYGVAITNGASVAPITTFNVTGLFYVMAGAVSEVCYTDIEHTSAEGIQVSGQVNCVEFDNIWVNVTGRDAVLWTGAPGESCSWRQITAQQAGTGQSSGTFACFHVLGQSGTVQFQRGGLIDGLYLEQSGIGGVTSYGLWLQNVGSIHADTVALQGGVAPYTGQVCVQIDATLSNPTTQDGQHASNIILQNLFSSQVRNGGGRTLLVDSVRGVNTGSTANSPQTLTQYATENYQPGVVGTFQATQFYPVNYFIAQGNQLYSRNTQGVSGASFAADAANWTSVVSSLLDRERKVRFGTLTAFRASLDPLTAIASNLAIASGTQSGAHVEVLVGESYDHATFKVGSTPATFAANNDGTWYIAVYDDSGNLVTQTAAQGTAALAATAIIRLALNATVTPAADAAYSVVLMVYIGTGAGGVMPTIASVASISTTTLITGMPSYSVTGNTAQTSGTAPGTLGSAGTLTSVPFIALYK